MFAGGGVEDFWPIARETLRQLIAVGGLRPCDRVLDVGCGVGRMALALAGYLAPEGSYEGFDIVAPGVEWCRTHVTRRFPRFRFQAADVHNADYNPQGRCHDSEYTFPYPDASFDFVLLASVFTHMLPAGVENYVYEISRVLTPGGRCFITFFLWNDKTAALVRAGKAMFSLRHERGVYRIEDRRHPEAVVCYDEAHVVSLLAKYGLELDGPVHYGSWSGRENCFSGQDVVTATRARTGSPAKPWPSFAARLARTMRRSARAAAGAVRYALFGGRRDGWERYAEAANHGRIAGGSPAARRWRGLVPMRVRRLTRLLLERKAA
jgi:SAM-dependent methyltransferase